MDDEPRRLLSAPLVLRAARGGVIAWSVIGILVLGYFLFRFVIYPVRVIFPPLVVAVIAVYLLNPVVSAMERRRIPRLVGTLITYLIGLAIFGTAMAFAVPVVADQVESFARSAPRLIDQVTGTFRDFVGRVGLPVEGAAPGGEGVVDFFGQLLSFTRGLFDLALVFVLGPILGFYLLVDLPKIRRGIRAVIPERRRAEVEQIMQKVGRAIGGFFRGQLLVAAFVGVAGALVLYVVGLPFWAVVGLVTGLFNLIPLIGPFIGGAVAVIIAFTTDRSEGLLALEPGWPLALGSAVALLIVQQIDNHILSPNIVARTVHLHPVTVMLGLLTGGALLGLWGVLLAVPVLASVKIVLLHAWDTRMQWPPPGEAPVPVPPRAPPEERLERAGRPRRETERRGSWWTNAVRSMFGRSAPVAGGDPRPDRAPEPERTTGG